MLIRKVLALASDWLRAVLWYIVITLAFTTPNMTGNWDGSGLWNCLIISLMLFVPKIYKTIYCVLLYICHIHVGQSSTFKVILIFYNFTCDYRNTLFLGRSSYSPYH